MKTTKKENMKLLTTLYEIGFNHYNNNLSLSLSPLVSLCIPKRSCNVN